MKIKGVICKKEDKKGMLWLVEGGGEICTKCYNEEWKKGIAYLVMPLRPNAID